MQFVECKPLRVCGQFGRPIQYGQVWEFGGGIQQSLIESGRALGVTGRVGAIHIDPYDRARADQLEQLANLTQVKRCLWRLLQVVTTERNDDCVGHHTLFDVFLVGLHAIPAGAGRPTDIARVNTINNHFFERAKCL